MESEQKIISITIEHGSNEYGFDAILPPDATMVELWCYDINDTSPIDLLSGMPNPQELHAYALPWLIGYLFGMKRGLRSGKEYVQAEMRKVLGITKE